MGPNYKFKEWSDSWLMTSGVNTLVPNVKYGADESIEGLEIKQLVDPVGNNKLRKSKIDIGIYDKDYNLHLIPDVVLSQKNDTTVIDQKKIVEPFIGPVKAIVLNHGDHAYLKVRFDEQTLDNFV